VLQCVRSSVHAVVTHQLSSVLQCVAVCCNVLQFCSVLQCAAVCCSVLQCVAMCYSGSSAMSTVAIKSCIDGLVTERWRKGEREREREARGGGGGGVSQ